jgi:hypothetical protein
MKNEKLFSNVFIFQFTIKKCLQKFNGLESWSLQGDFAEWIMFVFSLFEFWDVTKRSPTRFLQFHPTETKIVWSFVPRNKWSNRRLPSPGYEYKFTLWSARPAKHRKYYSTLNLKGSLLADEVWPLWPFKVGAARTDSAKGLSGGGGCARGIWGLENAVDTISDAEKPSAFSNAPFNPSTSAA